jgi:hypothetical protein
MVIKGIEKREKTAGSMWYPFVLPETKSNTLNGLKEETG